MGTFTITGKARPGQTVAASVFTGVYHFEFDIKPKSILTLYHDKGISQIEIGSQTTWTTTLSGGDVTVTIS